MDGRQLYINPDNIAEERFGGWNSMDAVYEAALYAARLRERLLAERKSMIFETVMSAPDKVDFIRRAKDAGFFVRVFFISTSSPKINASRIAARVMEGGHDVPISRLFRDIRNLFLIVVSFFFCGSYLRV